ncbi:alpha,alpha-trehalose-phosphate synthase (UDP-forming) [Arenibaculum pallidiluteum]|uniref:alpha,alpha-trehalose-phosphate synthase (UDP-forming) n=1 Tax=Arenibaculum pallidiluteum TaxID=2812559 RepID=UPI001A961960|nr:alpha,alpha-trehalose-phosphate synthase (UDP-forming) [Arenibaculum pallidiluteum]
MARLVVVSNRVAPIEEGKQQAGGLAVAVMAALKKTGGVWFGWSGETVDADSGELTIARAGAITRATIDLSRRDYDEYYNGFANSVLWPLFHYRIGLLSFSRRTWEGYLRVNALFAEKLAPLLRGSDMVWVHDYHLIPVGERLRERGLENPMGFFLHTPWPAPEVLIAVPTHAALVKAMCAYDVVGFHTESDLHSFANYIRDETGGTVEHLGEEGMRIRAYGRTVLARAFPISIDTGAMTAVAQQAGRTVAARRLRESLVGRDLIIGVDRLDYSKGLPQRFEAFQCLLDNYPELRGKVSFMQIAPPSRSDVPEYAAIRRELEAAAGHINGRFADFDWVPLRYLNKSFSQKALAGFFRTARIGLVTPLRDGMNLVAKEYVACQDPDDPGVLVLSRFAGAAAEMREALIVNPFDAEGVADAIQRGLTMRLEERRERHAALMAHLRRWDIVRWREEFVAALASVPTAAERRRNIA